MAAKLVSVESPRASASRPPLLARNPDDHLTDDGHHLVAPEAAPERVDHRREDARLDFTARQHTHCIQAIDVFSHWRPPAGIAYPHPAAAAGGGTGQ